MSREYFGLVWGEALLARIFHGTPSILDNVMLCCMSADTQTHMCICSIII